MEIEEKLQLIKDNKISIEKIQELERVFNKITSVEELAPNGEVITSKADLLLSLLIQIQLTILKDSLAENMKRDIEFSEQVIGLKEQAESLMKDMGKHFGNDKSDLGK